MAVELEGLELQVTTSAEQAVSGLEKLTAALTGLKDAAQGGAGLTTVGKQLERISSALSAMPQNSVTALKEVGEGLSALSQGEYGNKGLNQVANQLQKVNEAVQTLNIDPGKVSQLSMLRESLSGLSNVEAATGLRSTINALMKLPALGAELDKVDFDKFAGQIQRASAALEPLATQMDRVSRGFQAFPIRIQKIIASNQGLVNSNNKAAQSFGGVNKAVKAFNVAVFVGGLKVLGRLMGQWVSQSNDYVENLNLFTVAMGDAAQEAYDYAQTVREAVGIDPSDWMRNQGVFMQIASGFGVANDKAVLMSKNLTQLGYDISSFFNISVEDAMQKVQSGISGELEPLRRLGYALDQATLKEIARSEGITKSFNAMTQAEKSQLRYIAIMKQSNNVMGDMARTVLTPANAMRILQQQIQQLTRALGNLLIPFLLKLIPVVQAVVEALTEFINMLAALAGFELPKIDYSGLGAAASGAEAVEDALDGATAAAKKFSTTLGIDELNIISPPDNSGSGAADAGGGFADLDLPGYDFLKDLAEETAELKDNLKDLLVNYVLPIGAGLAAWKISKGVMDAVSAAGGLKEYLGSLKTLAGVAVAAGGAVMTVVNAFDAFENGLTNSNLARMLAGISAVIGGLGLAFGPMGAAIGAAGSAVVLFTVALKDLNQNGINPRNVAALTAFGGALAGVAKVFGGPIAGAVAGISVAIGGFTNALDIASDTAYTDLSSMDESFKMVAVSAGGVALAVAALGGGPVVAGLAAVAAAAVEFYAVMQTDAIPAFELFDETVSEATKNAVEPFLDKTNALQVHLKKLKFSGTVIDANVVADTMGKVDEIVSVITDNLDATKNERLATLAPLDGFLGEEQYALIQEKVGQYYTDLGTSVTEGQAEINRILSQAQNNNGVVTEEGWARINEIQAQMQDTGIQALSKSQVEYETIMRNLRDNSARISLEQASEIIKNAQQARDETIAAAETQYTEITLQAEQLRQAGVINDEEYQAMIDAATQAKTDTIAQANEQYTSILTAAQTNLGNLAKYIDENNGAIKTKWDVFWGDLKTGFSALWSGLLTAVKDWWDDLSTFWGKTAPEWWDKYVKPWFTVEKWKELGTQAINGLFAGLGDIWESAAEWGEDMLAGIKDVLGIASPSKEFRDIGNYAMAGLENGFGDMSYVTNTFTNELKTMKSNADNFAGETKTMVDNGLSQFETALNSAQVNNTKAVEAMTNNYRTMASNSNGAINSIITKLNSIPRSITTVHTVVTKTVSGGSSGGSSGSSGTAKGYATGGFPRAGELFYARENGFPELVGQVNGRTAVANNDQIVEAVSQGVAQAVAGVLGGSGGGVIDLRVYMDSREIKAAIERADREAGAGIMNGGGFGL